MLAQAEHDPGSAILVTPRARRWPVAVAAERTAVGRAWTRAAHARGPGGLQRIIVVADLAAACEVANDFATGAPADHHVRDDEAVLAKIRHAGAIFLGPYTPVPLGDYYAGPSHVLPTGGTAQFFGPLSCNDFLKASSVDPLRRGRPEQRRRRT